MNNTYEPKMCFTPQEIVNELSRFIIGQNEAKKSVAVALRNRYRRSMLPLEEREEITPKNIIMQGPTGVGKTEIARRLAKLVKAPFLKVEATKYTEVGYVGRDVESMIRDLVAVSVRLVRDERFKDISMKASDNARNIIVKYLFDDLKPTMRDMTDIEIKNYILTELANGKLDNMMIFMDLPEKPKNQQLMPGSGIELNLGSIFGGALGANKTKKRRVSVANAYEILLEDEANKLIDEDSVNDEAIRRAENEGIIFIDEIDKIATKNSSHGQDVSREGVQRDILPIVEGCTVTTKYGSIRTDFILFIAAGAFHISEVSDLIPELQGRFPISVKLDSLTEADFVQILTEPDNAILNQYKALLGVDNILLNFTTNAIAEIAKIAAFENENKENIGARRLHTIMESLLEEISFTANPNGEITNLNVDKEYVQQHLGQAMKEQDLRKYIL